MNAKEQQQFQEYWKTIRRKGPLRYIFLTALSWGTISAVMIRLFMTIFDQGLNGPALVDAFNSREFLLYWAVFLVGGLFYALTMWLYYNWQFRKIQKAKS